MLHSHFICMCGHGDIVYVLVRKDDIFAKCLDYISDHWLGNTKFHPYGFAGKHIDVFFHILSKIQSLSFCASQRFKRFCGFIQNFQFSDTVKPIIGNIIVFIVITDKIILSFFCRHLVRGNNILTFTSIWSFTVMYFFICSVFGIFKNYFTVMADSFIQQLNIEKNLLVIRFVLRQSDNMLHTGVEINTGQPL